MNTFTARFATSIAPEGLRAASALYASPNYAERRPTVVGPAALCSVSLRWEASCSVPPQARLSQSKPPCPARLLRRTRVLSSRRRLPPKLKPRLPLRGHLVRLRGRAPTAVLTAWVAVAATVKIDVLLCSGDHPGDGGRGNPPRG